ncbi:hypothetical protein Q604_UNBc4C00180G0002 [human gut metagenome]|uniref:Uncharacterized protein n=1 Tax=human gut metagenome TaxID=408170 RepID=W1WCJ9_9ZZZZ
MGDFLEMDLPRGEKFKENDKVEVLSAEIVGTHDDPRVVKWHHFAVKWKYS